MGRTFSMKIAQLKLEFKLPKSVQLDYETII